MKNKQNEALKFIADRLTAWAESHEWRARNMPEGEECTVERNNAANYRELINRALNALVPEISKPQLNPALVARTQTGTPEALNMYAYDVQGPGGIVRGVDQILNGDKVTFAACSRRDGDPPMVEQIITCQAMPGAACVRVCGENHKPDAPGSHTIVGSIDTPGSVADIDPRLIAAKLTYSLTCFGNWIFLLK